MKCKKAAVVVAGLFMALGAAAPAMADSEAYGAAIGSPGVLSGNVVQAPIHIPVNVCGNSVNVIGVLNPAAFNTCVNA
ncbi:chaplin [Streptomyces sp. NPDC046316]|uniref:chaplin n=1 Tax=unclassified Streptomyces TaxID=2593676 RepID=UPI0033FF9A00